MNDDKVIEKLIDGTDYIIELNTPELIDHFNDIKNCTQEILHQFNDLNYYANYISKDDKIILDLGGNIGLFALHVTPWADKIITVEPTPHHFTLNEQITGKFNNVIRLQAAVANKTGIIDFYEYSSNTTTNSLQCGHGSNKITVNSITIPDIMLKFNLSKIDFLKMDIEGSELTVLIEKTIEFLSKHVCKILIEVHEINDTTFDIYRDLYSSLFRKYGYNVEYFNADGMFCTIKIN